MISLAERFYDNKEYTIAIKYLKKAFFIDVPCDRHEVELLWCYSDIIKPLLDTIQFPIRDANEDWSGSMEEEFKSNIRFKLKQVLDDGIDLYENILLRLQPSNAAAPGSIEQFNIYKGRFHYQKAKYAASSPSESRNEYVKAKECCIKALQMPARPSRWYDRRLETAYKLVIINARELGALQDAVRIAEHVCKQADVHIPLLCPDEQKHSLQVLKRLQTVLNNWRNIQM